MELLLLYFLQYCTVLYTQLTQWSSSRHSGIDIIIVREQTEGEYTSLEHEVWFHILPLMLFGEWRNGDIRDR